MNLLDWFLYDNGLHHERVKNNIRLAREERNILPNPYTREEILVLSQEYQLTTNGHQFLVFGSEIGDQERIFIFASDLGLQFFYECDHWYADRTFKICPEVFCQVYTAHGQQRRRMFPCVF